VTIAGPSSDIVDFGGVAMAADGSGGLVFTKAIEGVPHIFASRFVGGRWSAPIRVDGDQPYEASEPRIAAGPGGELLVVWVTQVATVHNKIRYGLFSAKIGRGASAFGPSLLVDPEVAEGNPGGVDPSLSGTAPSQAIVAYRVITYRFDGSKPLAVVQLRPGDVLAETRLARLKEDRWSRLGAVNVNLEASTRAPSATNGPKVGAGVDGGAVVAWQEPDQSGAARVYVRRIFGTVPGPILQASPGSWEGAPVTGDVDAFSLAVTPLDQARIAMRIAGNNPQAPARLFLNTLPPGFAVPSNALVGPKQVFTAASPAPTAIGLPGLAAYEKGGQEGLLRLGFVAGSEVHQMGVDQSGKLTPIGAPPGPTAIAGGEVATALDPEGGAIVAYPALDASHAKVLAVRQEFRSGAAQTGLLSGAQGGPIAELRVGDSGAGDALVGFRQGEPGHFQIVADRVSAPPAPFRVKGPKGWTGPRAVRLRWQAAASAVGGITYAVLLDGRTVKQGLRRRVFHPRPGMLGNGRVGARVMATDALGQQVLSKQVKLLVDGEPPLVRVEGPNRAGRVAVRVHDADSGARAKATSVRFGDGVTVRGKTRARHVYVRPGRYEIVVRARDRVGNRATRRFEVRVP
jgi:PKD domain